MPSAKMSANLSHEEAGQFFRLMWALQRYVNHQLKLVPKVESAENYAKLGTEDKLKVREALWAHPELLDDFVAENPAGLPPEELQIVEGWKQRVTGEFYILRFLKRYAVFLSAGEEARVYGVLGLYESLEDVLYGQPLPIMKVGRSHSPLTGVRGCVAGRRPRPPHPQPGTGPRMRRPCASRLRLLTFIVSSRIM